MSVVILTGCTPAPLASYLKGLAILRLVAEQKFGMMVALQPPRIVAVPIEEALAKPRRVPLDSDSVATARDLGVSFGD